MKNFEHNTFLFTADGVIDRLQFFGMSLLNGICLGLPFNILLTNSLADTQPTHLLLIVLMVVLGIASTYGAICNTVKRVRDIKGEEYETQHGVWWYLGVLVPFVNIVVAIRLLFQRGRITHPDIK